MPEISYAEKADPDSIYADEDRAPLIEATQSEQAGRFAEILWLEQKLIGPLRPHKEDRLRRALANTEALYEAQWIELEMAVGSRTAFEVRRCVEAQQELQWGQTIEPAWARPVSSNHVCRRVDAQDEDDLAPSARIQSTDIHVPFADHSSLGSRNDRVDVRLP